MTEFENVREALDVLISLNSSDVRVNGNPATIEDIKEDNREIAYQICDLLGCSDLYLERVEEA